MQEFWQNTTAGSSHRYLPCLVVCLFENLHFVFSSLSFLSHILKAGVPQNSMFCFLLHSFPGKSHTNHNSTYHISFIHLLSIHTPTPQTSAVLPMYDRIFLNREGSKRYNLALMSFTLGLGCSINVNPKITKMNIQLQHWGDIQGRSCMVW